MGTMKEKLEGMEEQEVRKKDNGRKAISKDMTVGNFLGLKRFLRLKKH